MQPAKAAPKAAPAPAAAAAPAAEAKEETAAPAPKAEAKAEAKPAAAAAAGGISAGLVKELRESTGAGMMDCKKALAECGGDLEKAKEVRQEAGSREAATAAWQPRQPLTACMWQLRRWRVALAALFNVCCGGQASDLPAGLLRCLCSSCARRAWPPPTRRRAVWPLRAPSGPTSTPAAGEGAGGWA